MLVALGVSPVTAILSCLVANGVPTMFGSIGIPTTTLASITGLDAIQLALTQAVQVIPFVIACPIIMVCLVGGGPRALKGATGAALVARVSFAVPEDVVASVCSLGATFAYGLATHSREVPEEHRLQSGTDAAPQASAGEKLRAWSPFLLIFLVLLLTSQLVPAIHDPLSSIATTVNAYSGDPSATLTFTWVNTPGVLILACGIVGGVIQRCPAREMLAVMGETCKQMSKTVITMLGVLACAKVMGYSGMIASIAAFFVAALGPLYPLVAPLLGALGTFVTGSGTSSEVLFGNVQLQAATTLGVDPTWLVASNSLGVSAGKMLSPQNIAIGCSAVGLVGQDGKVMGSVAMWAFAFAAAMSVLVFVGSLVL